MISQTLEMARAYEETEGNKITEEQRPLFHLSPRVGWMNDPNGFSRYQGLYHLFYQYYPYNKKWGPMHWGHAVSKDLLQWEYLPAALAPDTPADNEGCFSGSAVELDDGRHLLMYTGVVADGVCDEDGMLQYYQTQCIAVGDGINYEKYEGNPVLNRNDTPDGSNGFDFRDPKVWRDQNGGFHCVVVDCTADKYGRILYYTSNNGFEWKFVSILAENDGSLGRAWECPDVFEIDGKTVILVSPMEMTGTDEFLCGNSTLCMIGTVDRETGNFRVESRQTIDCGIDFYATQTLLNEDGRRIMTAWMQNWDTIVFNGEDLKWEGQIILPRELSVKDGRLYQRPIRELEQLRKGRLEYKQINVSDRMTLNGVRGRTTELIVEIVPETEDSLEMFEIRLAEKGELYTSLIYRPHEQTLEFDRSHSGARKNVTHVRKCRIDDPGEKLKLDIILDRYSCEVFINDGRQVMSNVIYTDQEAVGISFNARGYAVMDLVRYGLSAE